MPSLTAAAPEDIGHCLVLSVDLKATVRAVHALKVLSWLRYCGLQ